MSSQSPEAPARRARPAAVLSPSGPAPEPVTSSDRVRSRRAVLAGLLGGVGTWAATTLSRAAPVAAANGDTVHVGDQNLVGTLTTVIASPTSSISVIWGNATSTSGTGVGLRGDSASASGFGVWGTSGPGTGVLGSSSSGAGVQGKSESDVGVWGSSPSRIGVYGECPSGIGVYGVSSSGTGVRGASSSKPGVRGVSYSDAGVYGGSTTDAGVYGISTDGYGVWGTSTARNGVFGHTAAVSGDQAGVTGWCPSSSGLAKGVRGEVVSPDGVGVEGFAKVASGPAAGVSGITKSPSGAGTVGLNLATTGNAVGVRGSTSSLTGQGVVGIASGGQGVRGQATSGVGLFGTADAGYALRTSGRVKVDKVSGVASIPAGTTSITITPGVDVTSASFALLTPRVDIGSRRLWFTTDAANNRLTIRISSSRTTSTPVAWLMLG